MENRRMYLLALVVAAAGLVLGACGDDDDTADATDDASGVTEPDAGTDTDDGDAAGGDSVSIIDFAFSPEDLTIAPGAEITVTNGDTAPHTYTSEDGGFDSGSLSADGGEGTVTAPDDAGTYDVICTIHPAITGTLTVEG